MIWALQSRKSICGKEKRTLRSGRGPLPPVISNSFSYTGRRLDSETGLYYYRNRYYHAQLGRFVSRDPIGYVDGWNLYEYVGGNPATQSDPSGLVSSSTRGLPDWDVREKSYEHKGCLTSLLKDALGRLGDCDHKITHPEDLTGKVCAGTSGAAWGVTWGSPVSNAGCCDFSKAKLVFFAFHWVGKGPSGNRDIAFGLDDFGDVISINGADTTKEHELWHCEGVDERVYEDAKKIDQSLDKFPGYIKGAKNARAFTNKCLREYMRESGEYRTDEDCKSALMSCVHKYFSGKDAREWIMEHGCWHKRTVYRDRYYLWGDGPDLNGPGGLRR